MSLKSTAPPSTLLLFAQSPIAPFTAAELAHELGHAAFARLRVLTPAHLSAVPLWLSGTADFPVAALIKHVNAVPS